MTAILLIVGVAVLAAMALYVYSHREEPLPSPLGAPRVKYLVISKTYQQACYHMQDVPRSDWRYVSDSSDILGYNRGDVELKLVGQWADHPIWNDPWSVQRLRSLGLAAHFQHETSL